jgi:hypothetical protein
LGALGFGVIRELYGSGSSGFVGRARAISKQQQAARIAVINSQPLRIHIHFRFEAVFKPQFCFGNGRAAISIVKSPTCLDPEVA